MTPIVFHPDDQTKVELPKTYFEKKTTFGIEIHCFVTNTIRKHIVHFSYENGCAITHSDFD